MPDERLLRELYDAGMHISSQRGTLPKPFADRFADEWMRQNGYRWDDEQVYCERCEQPFQRRASGPKPAYCSNSCRQAAYRERLLRVNISRGDASSHG
jgi:hypothetical protein